MTSSMKLTRRKGSNDPYEYASWAKDYFVPGRYGVRFIHTIEYLDGRDYEIKPEEGE